MYTPRGNTNTQWKGTDEYYIGPDETSSPNEKNTPLSRGGDRKDVCLIRGSINNIQHTLSVSSEGEGEGESEVEGEGESEGEGEGEGEG